jgi:hypothetical protein
MYGNGVYLVRLPGGKPFRQVYAMEGLAVQMAAKLGGKVVKVKWDAAPVKVKPVNGRGE